MQRLYGGIFIGAALLAHLGFTAAAQDYPTQVVRVIANQPPGGGSDLVTRLVAQGLQEEFGRPFIVENRAGASGAIGLQAVAQAAPDGHTLLVSASTIAINPALQNVTYNLEQDLTPISEIARGPYMLVARQSVPAENLTQLIAYARSAPQRLRWGLSNSGAGDHLAAALLANRAGFEPLFVPYRGAGPALNDLLGGQIDVVVFPLSVVMPHVGGGRLRAIAVTSRVRAGPAPDVPTIAESGFPGYEFTTWFGLWGPRGMPADTVARIRATLVRALERPEVATRLQQSALVPVASETDAFARLVSSELASYRTIVRENNIRE